ncbi:hypothetical protein PIB30_082366 [Stylosanthes scabra]|uniref:Putative plant transposon protein domain-containing protein n=1 Tax=Stylosanthes scabra TaxID=79078 RepID=A0ABU6VT05_9FABA|nr:hypothetical protein [Stylosanthes scabra]
MASSSSTISFFDAHCFQKVHDEQLFESYARRRKVIPEVGFNLNEDEYPQIMEQIALREAAGRDELPYKSFEKGKAVDFSPSNIRKVMRFKWETAGAETNYNTRKTIDQRLDEVLRDLCVPGATWKISSSQPAIPIQLRRTELQPLARGWQEFIIHSLVPTRNKLEVTTTRAILIHCIMRGEDVRAEDIIADNMATIAQGLTSKGNLAHPSTIYKLCRDAGAHNEQLFESYARTRKVIPEVGFNLNEDEYPQIMEQKTLRGWRRLAAPHTSISKLLVQEFYANAAVFDEEAAGRDKLPYKSFERGKAVHFSPSNIRRVMRFKRETAGAETDYNTHKTIDQRLDEVLRDLCVPGATWKMSSSQPAVPI